MKLIPEEECHNCHQKKPDWRYIFIILIEEKRGEYIILCTDCIIKRRKK